MGLLTSDLRYDQMRTVFMTEGAITPGGSTASSPPRADELRARLREDGVADGEIEVATALDCRYVGQGYELRIPLPSGRFARGAGGVPPPHEQEYGHAFRDPIEIVNLRVTASGKRPRIDRLPVSRAAAIHCSGRASASSAMTAPWPRTRHATTTGRCSPGEAFGGPAILFQRDTTTVVPPGWTARADASGSLILTR